MKEVTISLKNLYKEFDGQLENGCIVKSVDGDNEYYDLETSVGTVCMDGETCKVVSSDEFGYELLNTYGEIYTGFTLTVEEYNIATFQ